MNLQLLFIADLRNRRIDERVPEYKPGRQVGSFKIIFMLHRTFHKDLLLLVVAPVPQIVTFLLICNMALWITYNFEIQKVCCMLYIQ